jgi:Uma2 family endonuclease
MALAIKTLPGAQDDDAIASFARTAPGYRIEFDADGTMFVSPIFSDGAPREIEAAVQLRAFADRVGGKVFSSSTGFRLSDGSLRSPDASWLSAEHLERLTSAEKTKFWRTCPDIVIKILSESDDWKAVLEKTKHYIVSGAKFAIAIDPISRQVVRFGSKPEGLNLNPDAIIDA